MEESTIKKIRGTIQQGPNLNMKDKLYIELTSIMQGLFFYKGADIEKKIENSNKEIKEIKEIEDIYKWLDYSESQIMKQLQKELERDLSIKFTWPTYQNNKLNYLYVLTLSLTLLCDAILNGEMSYNEGIKKITMYFKYGHGLLGIGFVAKFLYSYFGNSLKRYKISKYLQTKKKLEESNQDKNEDK